MSDTNPNGTQAPESPRPAISPEFEQKIIELSIPINRSGHAIAAGYLALFSVIPFIFSPLAILFAILGLRDIKKNPTKKGKYRCYFALIVGIPFTLLWINVLIRLVLR